MMSIYEVYRHHAIKCILIDNRQLGYPVPGGNKYRNMTFQVGDVSKTESMKCTQLKTPDPISRQRKRPTSLNQKPSKII
jgi:hypothetical protein